MSTTIAALEIGELTNSVRDVFAQVTRYPLEILDLTASLEEDLGIDSVKLGEIFAVLREKYQLSDKLVIARENLKSITSIAMELHGVIAVNGGSQAGVAVPQNGLSGHHAGHPAAPAAATLSRDDFYTQVRAVFAEITRYPLDILEPNASLEEDLGIDSVKLGEVFAVLRERYSLPPLLDLPRERIKTIQGIAESLEQYVSLGVVPVLQSAPVVPVVAPVAAPVPVVVAAPVVAAVHENLDENIRAIFAEVTRYPIDILEANAALEEDLGIDSVKLGEVFAVLRERYKLPEELKVPRESLRTIGMITEALRQHMPAPAIPSALAPSIPATHTVTSNGHSNGHSNGAAGKLPPAVQNAIHVKSGDNRPFEGKIALVTGSGRALGKDIAVYLASLGATVIVNSFHSREQGVQTVEQIKAAGGKAIHAWGSVANPQQMHAIFDLIETEFGGLDFFVSNASNGMLAKLEDITVEHMEKAFRTNVIGLQQCSLRAMQLMKRRGGGKIITLSSPASHGYVDYFGCMAAVKAAVESLTKTMAIEFAPYNIQVNCVSPGPIYGDLLNKWPESKRLIGEWEQATVCDRLCVDRDVSHFIAYLLGDAVKLFTGSVLVMDGGISVRWGGVSGKPAENANGTAHIVNSNAFAASALPAYS
jgi:enoyl-[acyl-carrier protein] reductase III